MTKLITCKPSKRIKAADGIVQHQKGTGSMPDRSCLVEHKASHLSKNARRKAERYGKDKSVGHYVGTAKARLVCRERYKARLQKDFAILLSK